MLCTPLQSARVNELQLDVISLLYCIVMKRRQIDAHHLCLARDIADVCHKLQLRCTIHYVKRPAILTAFLYLGLVQYFHVQPAPLREV